VRKTREGGERRWGRVINRVSKGQCSFRRRKDGQSDTGLKPCKAKELGVLGKNLQITRHPEGDEGAGLAMEKFRGEQATIEVQISSTAGSAIHKVRGAGAEQEKPWHPKLVVREQILSSWNQKTYFQRKSD